MEAQRSELRTSIKSEARRQTRTRKLAKELGRNRADLVESNAESADAIAMMAEAKREHQRELRASQKESAHE
jgi:hypothetical protein